MRNGAVMPFALNAADPDRLSKRAPGLDDLTLSQMLAKHLPLMSHLWRPHPYT